MTEKLQILELIEIGDISLEEGIQLLSEENFTNQKILSNKAKGTDMEILELIENGELSIDEGLEKLQNSDESVQEIPDFANKSPGNQVASTSSTQKSIPISDKEMGKWRNWWSIPVFVGFTIVILSAMWMNSSYESSGGGFWFLFSWIPLFLGIVTMAVSWPSPNRTWMHIRIKQSKGHTPNKINVSIPIPLNIISWGLKIAKKYGPEKALSKLDDNSIDEIILGIGNSVSTGTPFYIVVDEGDNGEHIEIYFG